MPAVERARSTVRGLPVTLVLGTILITFMVASAGRAPWYHWLVIHLGVTWPDIAALRLWRVPTSSLVQEQPGIVWPIVALLPVLVAAERRFGSARTFATYALLDATSTVPVLGSLAFAGTAGSSTAQRLAETPNLGSSAGLVGLLAALIATLGGRARRLAAGALVVGLACGLALDWELAGVQHVIAAIAGGVAGLWLSRANLRGVRPSCRRWRRARDR